MNSPFDWPEQAEPEEPRYAFDGNDPEAVSRQQGTFVVPSPTGAIMRPEWDVSLVIDFALRTSDESIMEAHGLTAWGWDAIKNDAAFQVRVAAMRKELEKDGATFNLKCKLQADKLIDKSWQLIHDPATDPRVAAKLIADTVRWAGFDKAAGTDQGKDGFYININLGDGFAKKGSVYDQNGDAVE